MRERGLALARPVSADGWAVAGFSVSVIASDRFSRGYFKFDLPGGIVLEGNGLMEGPYFMKVSMPI